jgi:hypothetical protein
LSFHVLKRVEGRPVRRPTCFAFETTSDLDSSSYWNLYTKGYRVNSGCGLHRSSIVPILHEAQIDQYHFTDQLSCSGWGRRLP